MNSDKDQAMMTDPTADHDSSRRSFLATCMASLAGLTIVGMAAPLLSSCTDTITGIDPNYQATFDVSALSADGTALVSSSKGGDGFPVIIVRQSSAVFLALSSQCTHEACQVNAPSGSAITCSCHGSQFDLAGNVKRGPAGSALYKYATTYDSSTKTVTVKAA
jgi:nitrite reductase/ring-hydroxylating ferredoxin subunit